MTDIQKLDIDFYINGSAQDVLKRFSFSDKEKKLIQDAIRTAKMKTPRMKLIKEADELLKEVAKTREVIPAKHATTIPVEAMVRLDTMKFNAMQPKEEKKGIPFFYIPKTKLGRIIFFIMMAIISAIQYFTIENATDKTDKLNQGMYQKEMQLMQGY